MNNRNRFIKVRFTDNELAKLKDQAELHHMNTSELIRWALFDKGVTLHVNESDLIDNLEKILAQYGKIGSNLNQIARYLNEGGVLSDQLKNEIRSMISDLYNINTTLTKKFEEHYGNSKTHFE